MAHQGLTEAGGSARERTRRIGVGAALALAVGACGGGPRVEAPMAADRSGGATVFEAPGPWPAFHSKRFQLNVPLPDGRAWHIDDHRQPELLATHDATRSRVLAWAGNETDLMNRQRCEARARAQGFVPGDDLTVVEDKVETFPEMYDARIVVALGPARPKQPLAGHVMLFGAFLRRCLFVRFTSEVTSPEDEQVLSSRLAAARTRVVGKITLDPPRVRGDAEVPRAKPTDVPPPP